MAEQNRADLDGAEQDREERRIPGPLNMSYDCKDEREERRGRQVRGRETGNTKRGKWGNTNGMRLVSKAEAAAEQASAVSERASERGSWLRSKGAA
eukprot:1522032-Rhodomonas_salina.1